MTAEVAHQQLVSVEDYLAGELTSEVKHEYLSGMVYAMAGASNRHEVICFNLYGLLFSQLEGRPRRPFASNTKVRVRIGDDLRFYYPDALVVCRQNSLDDQFQDEPDVVFEVLSESTHRNDAHEKRSAYCALPSLRACVLIDQESVAAAVWRRTEKGFESEEYRGPTAIIEFPEIRISLSLDRIYRDSGLIT